MCNAQRKPSIQDNIVSVEMAMRAVKNHCMCMHFFETSTHYTVYYPNGYSPNGCTAMKVAGKACALRSIEEAMDRHWKKSLPNAATAKAKGK